MAAQMRHTLDCALVRQVVVLLDRTGVGVGAQTDRLLAIADRHRRDDTVLTDALYHVIPPGFHQVGDISRRITLFEGEFGVLVQVMAPGLDGLQPGLECLDDRVHCRSSLVEASRDWRLVWLTRASLPVRGLWAP